MKPSTIWLADDNIIVRRQIKKILECEADLEAVGEAKSGRQAVALDKRLRPALVLMDIARPLVNGLQATGQILKAVSATKVLMLYIEEAIKSGAMGYRTRHSP